MAQQAFNYDSKDEDREPVDFVYVIDCTGSMDSYIRTVRNDIEAVITRMNEEFPKFELRLGCVGYRDWDVDEQGKRLEYLPFTTDLSKFKKFVGNLRAFGGADGCEDVLGGLLCSVDKLEWTSNVKILFHICDAPPHNQIYHDNYSDYWPNGHPKDPEHYHGIVLNKMNNRGIHLCIARLNNNVTKMIKVFKEYGMQIGMEVEETSVKNCAALLSSVQVTLNTMVKIRKNVKAVDIGMYNLKMDLNGFMMMSANNVNACVMRLATADGDGNLDGSIGNIVVLDGGGRNSPNTGKKKRRKKKNNNNNSNVLTTKEGLLKEITKMGNQKKARIKYAKNEIVRLRLVLNQIDQKMVTLNDQMKFKTRMKDIVKIINTIERDENILQQAMNGNSNDGNGNGAVTKEYENKPHY